MGSQAFDFGPRDPPPIDRLLVHNDEKELRLVAMLRSVCAAWRRGLSSYPLVLKGSKGLRLLGGGFAERTMRAIELPSGTADLPAELRLLGSLRELCIDGYGGSRLPP